MRSTRRIRCGSGDRSRSQSWRGRTTRPPGARRTGRPCCSRRCGVSSSWRADASPSLRESPGRARSPLNEARRSGILGPHPCAMGTARASRARRWGLPPADEAATVRRCVPLPACSGFSPSSFWRPCGPRSLRPTRRYEGIPKPRRRTRTSSARARSRGSGSAPSGRPSCRDASATSPWTPTNPSRYFVAVASGGVWRTLNGGTTYEPVFDGEGSYSIGCVTLDPSNPHVVWVGTGENNSQRSVGFGDGVYRSRDGGNSWEHLGLKASEHIGMITVDPRDSDVVYVASQGPLWRSGGDRGLYKTVDGGETWKRILHVSDDTGINEVHLDPRNPDVLYASSYQRRRRVWTLINGGPESTIYKSEDAGTTWRTIDKGLPERGPGTHRTGRLSGRSGRGVRDRRGGAGQERVLPVHEPRRVVGEARRLQADGRAVLQRDRLRSGRRRSRVRAAHVPAGDGRRRKDVPSAFRARIATSTITRCGSTPPTTVTS